MWKDTRLALERLEELLICKICNKIVEDPLNLGNCDHFFCRYCIEGRIGESCPICHLFAYAANVQTNHRIAGIVRQCHELRSVLDALVTDIGGEIISNQHPSYPTEYKNTIAVEPFVDSRPNLSPVISSPIERTQHSLSDITVSPNPNCRISLGSTPTNDISSKLSSSYSAIKRRNAKGETALHLAAMKGRLEDVASLLKSGSNPNIKDNAGWTALHEACNHGYYEIVELLLDHGANINMPGFDKITPLHDAVSNQRTEVVKLLMSKGANPNLRNAQGCTPIDEANEDLKALIMSFEYKDLAVPVVPMACLQNEFVFLGTGLTELQRKYLKNFGKIFNADIVEEFNLKVTHLITSCCDQSTCPRTLKYLYAVITGKWIVSFQWIEECIKKSQLVSECDFEVKGTSTYPSCNGPKRGRLNMEAQKPGLFSGCNFYFHGLLENPSTPAKTDLKKLIHLGGGNILKKEPTLDLIAAAAPTSPFHATGTLANCSYYVLCEDNRKCTYKCDSEHFKSFPVSWLLECISKFRLVKP